MYLSILVLCVSPDVYKPLHHLYVRIGYFFMAGHLRLTCLVGVFLTTFIIMVVIGTF